ncbi:MAG TPA: DNA repair protein RecN [Flavobacteriales bacterium]|nr:DNA repair protein RecN [Flavobacteriales bacterium]
MLQNLYIKNYALIDEVNLDFKPGLTIITGETGAGKSILLGGLELIRGKRAQQGLLKDEAQKSIVEAVFNIKDYLLKPLFENEDLDYDDETIIRRELLPSGKSRAFVNDSPARLDSLSKLSDKLLDIHSQHQTLELNQKSFQFELLDAVACNDTLLSQYKQDYQAFTKLTKKLDNLIGKLDLAEKELSYKKFQLEELNALKLDDVDFDLLEQQIKTIDHQETISQILSESLQKLDDETIGVLTNIIDLKTGFQKIAGYNDKFQELAQRFESLHWEIQDIIDEVNRQTEANDFDPAEQERLQNQYAAINNLLLKHQVLDVEELKNLRDQLASEVTDLSSLEDQITDLKNDLQSLEQKLAKTAQKLHQNRLKTIPELIKQIETILAQLSMSNTRLKINLNSSDTFLPNGKDQLEFLISSDKGHSFGDIKRIASGGELSRLMLAVKTVLSKYKKLPTIIFDEIDTGISGEVAQNMAEVLKKLAENMQVLVITHLPQIAVKGDHHFKVYKTTENNQITTKVKQLNQEEQVFEIAEMLEGKQPSDSALKHARHLLSN